MGRTSLRHELDDYLNTWGGHIGYVVRPAFRRSGYDVAILRATLTLAAEHNIAELLVTCDDTNIGSIKVIETCGGVLENLVSGPGGGPPKRRYWVPISE